MASLDDHIYSSKNEKKGLASFFQRIFSHKTLASLSILAAASFSSPSLYAQEPAQKADSPVYIVWGGIKDLRTDQLISAGQRFIFYNLNLAPIDTFETFAPAEGSNYNVIIPSNRVHEGETLRLFWLDSGRLKPAVYESQAGPTLDYVIHGEYFDRSDFGINDPVVGVPNENPATSFKFSICPSVINLGQTGEVRIKFELPEQKVVSAAIYDIRGRLIKEIYNNQALESGVVTAHWDGCSQNGNPIASGVYFLKVQAGNETDTKKMVLTK